MTALRQGDLIFAQLLLPLFPKILFDRSIISPGIRPTVLVHTRTQACARTFAPEHCENMSPHLRSGLLEPDRRRNNTFPIPALQSALITLLSKTPCAGTHGNSKHRSRFNPVAGPNPTSQLRGRRLYSNAMRSSPFSQPEPIALS